MGNFLVGFVLPFLLLTSSLINWSLISLVDVIAFLLIQYAAPKIGYRFQRRLFLLWFIIIFSLVVILSQAVYLVIWGILGDKWSGTDAWWAHLIGFMIIHSWKSPLVIYFLVIQLLAVFVALVDVYWSRFGLVPWQDSCWGHFLNLLEHLGLLTSQGCFLFAVACHSTYCGDKPSLMAFSTIFYCKLCRSRGLVFNKQLSWTFQVVEASSAVCKR
ncbi:hypothetical protein OIU76_005337 [Salix suchowensis]|nr:hypothetical protein OIU78_015198 [Salix suchowensis]KAJ6343572.1 hypothetical protein OIU76_005337 [Salix suchowensis]